MATAPEICPGLAVEHLPLHSVFTDGTAVVENSAGELDHQTIDCVDRKLTTRNEVTDPTAITCKIRVDKCCALDEVFNHQERTCVIGEPAPETKFDLLKANKYGLIQVPGFINNNLENETAAHERNISSLAISDKKAVYLIDQTEAGPFCVETVVDGSRIETRVLVFPSSSPLDPLVFPEIPRISQNGTERCGTTLAINTALGSISIVSLIIMISVYLVLPELRNHHGLIVVSCALSTLLATLFLVVVYNYQPQLKEVTELTCAQGGNCNQGKDLFAQIPTSGRIDTEGERDWAAPGCTFLGFFGLFSNLSMFTWMSVMCWDLVRTFSRLRPPSSSLRIKKFLTYSAFGWLLPLLFTIICLILNDHDQDNDSALNPGIGVTSCFVEVENIPERRLIFFHLPMLLILLSNVAGFAFCLYHIHQTQKGARTASESIETR